MTRGWFLSTRLAASILVGVLFVVFDCARLFCQDNVANSVALRPPLISNSSDLVATDTEEFRKDELRCGVKCLYVMLSILGAECEFGELVRQVHSDSRGASLAGLQECAANRGASLECVRASPEAICSTIPLPAIIHLESYDDSKPDHFIVLLQVDHATDRVIVFDPAAARGIVYTTRAEFVRASTGYCLVPRVSLSNGWFTFLWTFAGILVLIPLVARARTRAGVFVTRYRQRVDRLTFLFCVAFLLLAIGCEGHQAPLPKTNPKSQNVASKLIDLANSKVDFGRLSRGDSMDAVIDFKNISDHGVAVVVSEPSCTCIVQNIEPKNGHLAPGGVGRLTATMKIHPAKPAGPIHGSIRLSVVDFEEVHSITLSGIVEGISGPTYVARPGHFQDNRFPPLAFTVYTLDASVPVSIDSVMPVSASFSRSQAASAPSVECVHLLVDHLVISESKRSYQGGVYRTVSVPVSVDPIVAVTEGKFRISYRLGDVRAVSDISFLLFPE